MLSRLSVSLAVFFFAFGLELEKLVPDRKTLEEFKERFGHLARPQEPKKEKKGDRKVVFYFFSRTVPKNTVRTVFRDGESLKGYEFYGVLRGIDEETLRYLSEVGLGRVKVKVNPLLFKKAQVSKVPAFALARCKGERFSRDCEVEAVLFGDVSLEFALEKIEEAIR